MGSDAWGKHRRTPPPVAPVAVVQAPVRQTSASHAAALVMGVLLLQLGFILSYVGAFHQPAPTRIPIVVVAPAAMSGQLVATLDALPQAPLRATAVADEAAARQLITTQAVDAALLVDPTVSSDRLLVATGAGPALAGAVEQIVGAVDATRQRTVEVVDVVPLRTGDGRGLTPFYLVIGWILGGYLVAAVIGVTRGSRASTARRSLVRLAVMVPYAMVSGVGGALVVGPLLGALSGRFLALSAIGTLIVLSAAVVTFALQASLGVAGIGVTILLFVVLGSPSAGGPYPPPLLPTFWRVIGGALPNGAGTTAVRNTVYFSGAGTVHPLLVLGAYVLAGALLTVTATAVAARHSTPITALEV